MLFAGKIYASSICFAVAEKLILFEIFTSNKSMTKEFFMLYLSRVKEAKKEHEIDDFVSASTSFIDDEGVGKVLSG